MDDADLTEAQRELRVTLDVDVSTDRFLHALTHRSFAFESGGIPDNERLEFLGDSVLGLAVTDELFRRYSSAPESTLARMRASIVSSQSLADLARGLGVGPAIRLGIGEERTDGADKTSILADTMEAIIGAIYLDCGREAAMEFVVRILRPQIAAAGQRGAGLDWKTSLQELTSQLGLGVPEYRITATGPDHAKQFTAQVVVADTVWGTGTGTAKKPAEQIAANIAWEALSAAHNVDSSGHAGTS